VTHRRWDPTDEMDKERLVARTPTEIKFIRNGLHVSAMNRRTEIPPHTLPIRPSQVEKREIPLSPYSAKPSSKEGNFLFLHWAKSSRRRGKLPSLYSDKLSGKKEIFSLSAWLRRVGGKIPPSLYSVKPSRKRIDSSLSQLS